VHQYPVRAPAGVAIELRLQRTAGEWNPAIIVHDEQGATIHDGEHSASDATMTVELVASGRDSDLAAVRVTAQQERLLSMFVTGWQVIDSGFVTDLPTDAEYTVTDEAACERETGTVSPPNFDPNDIDANGYYLLPDSEPDGLYTHRHEDCSRGTELLIDVLYTVALRWSEIHPDLMPIQYGDLNEAWCGGNHETHDDGTHADATVDCATYASCADNLPAIDLAMLFVDTGVACGIIFDDLEVLEVVNAYFHANYTYVPWHGEFMRSIGDHDTHFHIRVMTPDGDCI
jgi:hypothetical protein